MLKERLPWLKRDETENGTAKCEKLGNRIRKRTSRYLAFEVALVMILLLIGCFVDSAPGAKESLYKMMDDSLRTGLTENGKNFFDIALTANTIVAAGIIYFYSISDNKRVGIPFRVLMSYIFGAYTVPVLFMAAICLMPVIYLLAALSRPVTLWLCLLSIFEMQITVLVMILLSTSYRFGVRVICYTEIKQLQYVWEMAERDKKYVWGYLTHHMEQAIISEDIIVDRINTVRELLKTPFCKTKKLFYGYGWDDERLRNERYLGMIYEYYYLNLSAVFRHMGTMEEYDTIFQILYSFIDELNARYARIEHVFETSGKNYMMVLAAVMNAVLESGAANAEAFCNHIMNEYVVQDVWEKQVGIYLFLQEFQYRIQENYLGPERIDEINGIGGWEYDDERDWELYAEFWEIWSAQTSVSREHGLRFFEIGHTAFKGGRIGRNPISYAMIKQKQMKGNYL